MRTTLFPMLIFVIGCQYSPRTSTSTIISQTETSSYRAQVLLPQKVTDYLKNKLYGYLIPDTSDYSKAWWSFYERDQIPYAVSADLNGDNLDDYGVILKQSNTIRLVILLTERGLFKHWIANDFKEPFSGNDIQFGLKVEPPGKLNYFVDGQDKALLLERKGIALMNLEVKQKIYYWSDKGIKVFKTR